MVGAVCGGSRRASAVPGEYGCDFGWIVFTAQSPHTTLPCAASRGGFVCWAGVDGQVSVSAESFTVPVAL
jgi:hypothetical protein